MNPSNNPASITTITCMLYYFFGKFFLTFQEDIQ